MSDISQKRNKASGDIAGRDINKPTYNYLHAKDRYIEYTNNFFEHSSFSDIINKIAAIDNKIINVVRDISQDKYKQEVYNTVLKSFSEDENIEFSTVIQLINEKKLQSKSFNVNLFIKVSEYLKKLNFIYFDSINNSKKYICIKNPFLLWDCNCKVPSPDKFKKLNCKIHSNFSSQKQSEFFDNCFKNGSTEIHYEGIKIIWQQLEDLWPPAIDTMNLIGILKKLNLNQEFIKTAIDVGCGTGIIGLWLAKNIRSLSDIYFSDWLLMPLIFSYYNSLENRISKNCHYFLGTHTNWINAIKPKDKFDLLVCNPPYLPDLGYNNLLIKATVAGTELLEHIIINSKNIAKKTIISFSEIAMPEALRAAQKANINIENCKLPFDYTVPFRVKIAFDEPGYIEKLMNDKSRKLDIRETDYYPYWHTISTYLIE